MKERVDETITGLAEGIVDERRPRLGRLARNLDAPVAGETDGGGEESSICLAPN